MPEDRRILLTHEPAGADSGTRFILDRQAGVVVVESFQYHITANGRRMLHSTNHKVPVTEWRDLEVD